MGLTLLKNTYSIGKKIKEDNFGIYYEGLQANKNPIAIREYHKKFCHPSIVDQIQHAIMQLAGLSHPHIVKIIDSVYTEDQRFFLIYDTPYEGTLADILAKIEKFPEKESVAMLQTIGKTVEYAHQKGIWHGGLCPENILMLADGQLKLQNFYIDNLLNAFALTKGQVLLNPMYLAPEQLKAEQLKKMTDVYALGVLAYRLLSGHNPYPEISSVPMMLRNMQRKPESLIVRNPALPIYLEDIIFKAMEVNTLYRQQTILELLGDLQAKKATIRVEEIKMRQEMQKAKKPAAEPVKPMYQAPPIPAPARPSQPRGQMPVKNYNYRTEPMPKSEQNIKTTPSIPGRRTKKAPFLRILSIVIFCFLIGVVVAIIQSLFTNYFASVPKIEIPNITGVQVDDAIDQLRDRGLKFKIIGYVSDSAISQNCIVSTLPEHGRIVKKYRLIKLYVSKGNEQFTVPALVESNINQIEPILKEKGFGLKVVERVYSTEFPPNIIISQTPEAHAVANKGSEIQVVVSKGYPVSISLVDSSKDTAIVKLAVENLENWEPNNITIYIQDSNGRRKYQERLLKSGEKLVKEITTEPDALIEVYYFNNMALKQEIKNLILAAEEKTAEEKAAKNISQNVQNKGQ